MLKYLNKCTKPKNNNKTLINKLLKFIFYLFY